MRALIARFKRAWFGLRQVLLPPAGDKRTLIGQLLKQRRLIDDAQLDQALNLQKKRHHQLTQPLQLGRILVELGYVSEKDVVDAINDYYQLSVHSLSDNLEALIRKKHGSFFQRLSTLRIPIWMQLCLTITFVTSLTILCLSLVVLNQQREELYRHTVQGGKVILNYFANNAPLPLLEDEDLKLRMLIKDATQVEGIRYAFIVDHQGQIRMHTDVNQMDKPFTPPQTPKLVTRSNGISHYTYIGKNGERLLNMSQTLSFRKQEIGEVHIGLSVDFIETLVEERARFILFLSLIFILFGVVVAVLFSIRLSRPVSKLAEATRQIGRGNYQYRVDLIRNDELGDLAGAFNQMGKDLWMKSLMQDSFGKYVGAEVLNLILDNPKSVWLKGRRTEATVLFTDIRGFTSYSEVKEPEEVVEKLNDYFDIASRIILEHGGYVDKFVGDAVLGVFGVPAPHPDHIERAVQAAFEMQKAFVRKGEQLQNPLLQAVGIGLNTGVVVSGNIGSQAKMEYTVIGDTVNVASRLNGLAGPGEVILSKSIYQALQGQITAEARPPQKIKGKLEPLEVFRLLDFHPSAAADR